jgi:hypothetical protein
MSMTDNKNSRSTSSQSDAAADSLHKSECLLTNAEEAGFYAQKLLYYKNLLIEQCDGWLSEEEGRKNQLKIKRNKHIKH